MSKELTSSFEPYNEKAMVDDYYGICNQLQIAINAISKTTNVKSRQKMITHISTLNHRKEGFERQFETENIEYIKR